MDWGSVFCPPPYGTGEKAQTLRLPRGFPGFQIVLPVTEIFIIFILFCRGGGP